MSGDSASPAGLQVAAPAGDGLGGPRLSYLPALDGIRALAVLGVMAYHGGIPFLPAGFLGVDAFFVLSGFLITSLLLEEWGRTATVRLRAFWARRARRLLPALVLMILFVVCYAAFVVPGGTYPTLRSDGIATLFYAANWHFIAEGANYFNQAQLPSPFTHTWSLAIEEQFYLVWPLVVLVVLKRWRSTGVLLAAAAAGAVASAVEMALLYRSGAGLTRLYYGTDTHAQCLLVGVALAIALSRWAARRAGAAGGPARAGVGAAAWAVTGRRARWGLGALGALGLAGGAVLWWRSAFDGGFLWQGGFLVAALCAAAVILCVVCVQGSAVARVLSLAPLCWLGRISYGVYLWHYPLFLWIDGARTGLSVYPLFAVRSAVTLAVATLSYVLVEAPLRRGALTRGRPAWAIAPATAAATVGALVAVSLAPGTLAVATPSAARGAEAARAPSPHLGSLYSGPAVKVVIEGDSTALSLGLGLAVSARSYDVEEYDTAIEGCGVTEGKQVEVRGVVSDSYPLCNGAAGTEQWPQYWAGWIDGIRPAVVVVLAGRWEVVDRTYHGQWTNILHPAFAAYVERGLERAVSVAGSTGARVVLMTAPCYDTGEQPDGQPWPEDMPARVDAYNRLVAKVAASNPRTVTLFDLHALTCPGGAFEGTTPSGVAMRSADGIHFTLQGGESLAPKIWPLVVQLGREQMAAAHRPGPGA